jgi:hypothetical protein
LLQNKIEFLKVKNRYAKNSAGYNTGGKSIDYLEKKLREEKYNQYNEQVVNNPKYIPTNKIIYEAKENLNTISYLYIKNMKVSDLSTDAIKRREAQIIELQDDLEKINHNEWKYFKGDILWLAELKELKHIVKQGMEYGWSFNEAKIIY